MNNENPPKTESVIVDESFDPFEEFSDSIYFSLF